MLDVRLPAPKTLVEAMRDEIMGLSQRIVLAVDDDHGETRARRARLHDQGGVHQPEPQSIRLTRILGVESNGKYAHLANAGDVFQRVAVEQASCRLRAPCLTGSLDGRLRGKVSGVALPGEKFEGV